MQKTGAVLLGISPDTPKAQKKFKEKYDLPFTLLADADKKVAEAFGVMKEKNMYGKKVMGSCAHHIHHRSRRQDPAYFRESEARGSRRRGTELPKGIGQDRSLGRVRS